VTLELSYYCNYPISLQTKIFHYSLSIGTNRIIAGIDFNTQLVWNSAVILNQESNGYETRAPQSKH